ncbi:MAG: hypothetical protein HY928_09560, partial [Elusimicrobia bacterium]|nr:hypothetical protein [Elusimicrobiota bacterium]
AANRAVAQGLGGRPMRVLTAPELPNADKAMLYRMMNVNGYEAFYPASYAAYAARAEGRPAADPSRVYLSDPRSPELARLGVSAVVPGTDGAPYTMVAGARDIARLEGGGALASVSPRPELWRMRGAGAGPLVLSVPGDPGWRAWVDGVPAPVSPFDGLVMSVPVPDGDFTAAFRYAPALWPWLCAAAVLAWAAWAVVGMKELAS